MRPNNGEKCAPSFFLRLHPENPLEFLWRNDRFFSVLQERRDRPRIRAGRHRSVARPCVFQHRHAIGREPDVARSRLARQQIDKVSVVTQGHNLAAQRLYQRCGFLTHSIKFYYHKWFVDCRD